MRCITVLYPNSPGVRLDFDYYTSTHTVAADVQNFSSVQPLLQVDETL